MGEIFSNLRTTFLKLTLVQRIAVGGGFVSVLLLIVIMAVLYGQEEMVPLFDYIRDRKEALAVESKLRELQFKVISSEDGHVIRVPKSRKEAAHLALAEANSLPDAIVSYKEILDDKQSFGLTEKELDLRINRAKEGSISKTVMLFRNIAHAQVQIDKAKDSLFAEDQKDTRVSVLLTLKDPLDTIKAEQVKTILNLVHNSISSVKRENIFIADDKGTDLLSLVQDKDKKLDHVEITARKELELKKKAKDVLAEIYGDKNINVSVALELDFDDVGEESRELAPPVDGEEQGVKISEETKESDSETMDPKAVPGTQQNIPGYQSPETTKAKSRMKESRVNYAYKSKSKTLKRASGMTKRMTVSVVINSDVLPEKKMTDEIKVQIVEMVASAVGLDRKTRPDQISVTAFVFNKLLYEKTELVNEKAREFQSAVFATGVACLVFGTGLLVFRKMRQEARIRKQEMLRKAQESIEEQREDQAEVITAEQREKNERERALLEIAKNDPEQIVKVMRGMMFDENYY